MAWRSSSAAFLLVPLLPSTFLVYGLPLRPGFSFFFSFVFFFVSGVCSFHFHWASSLSVIGAMGGGWARGGSWLSCGLVGLLVFVRLGE